MSRGGLAAIGAALQGALMLGVLGVCGRLAAPLTEPGAALVVFGSVIAVAAEAAAQRGLDATPASPSDQLLAAFSGLGLLALLLLSVVTPGDARISAPATLAGGVAMAAGVALRCAAIRALGERFVTAAAVPPGGRLEITGVYRLVRHPSETGLLAFALGAAVVARTVGPLALWAAVLVPTTLLRIRREERTLSRTFAEEHRAYAGTTGTLIPKPSAILGSLAAPLRRRARRSGREGNSAPRQLPRSASKYIEPTRV